jgi:hypothetical protein
LTNPPPSPIEEGFEIKDGFIIPAGGHTFDPFCAMDNSGRSRDMAQGGAPHRGES